LQFFDVLDDAGVFIVAVLAALELVEAGLGILTLLDVQDSEEGHAGAGRDSAAQDGGSLEPV
jgi:hypothetical protein